MQTIIYELHRVGDGAPQPPAALGAAAKGLVLAQPHSLEIAHNRLRLRTQLVEALRQLLETAAATRGSEVLRFRTDEQQTFQGKRKVLADDLHGVRIVFNR